MSEFYQDAQANVEEYENRIAELLKKAQNHPPAHECSIDECSVCSVRDCPDQEPLHYHHDGCPACYEK